MILRSHQKNEKPDQLWLSLLPGCSIWQRYWMHCWNGWPTSLAKEPPFRNATGICLGRGYALAIKWAITVGKRV